MWVIANIFYNSSREFQWGSISAIISLVAAFIAAGSSVYGVKKNIQTQKDIAKQNIDANLKSSARIKWIGEVRSHTANLLNYYDKIKIADVSTRGSGSGIRIEVQNAISEYQKELLLLQLYFQNTDLLEDDKKINIRREISPFTFYKDPSIRNEEREKLDNEKADRKEAEKKNKELILPLFCRSSNDSKHSGIVNLLQELNSNVEKIVSREENEDSKYLLMIGVQHAQAVLDKYMSDFTSIIGIYLKIEWDRAKNGK